MNIWLARLVEGLSKSSVDRMKCELQYPVHYYYVQYSTKCPFFYIIFDFFSPLEFPQHTIKKMIALQDDKRTILLDLVRFGLRTTAHDKFLSSCLVST